MACSFATRRTERPLFWHFAVAKNHFDTFQWDRVYRVYVLLHTLLHTYCARNLTLKLNIVNSLNCSSSKFKKNPFNIVERRNEIMDGITEIDKNTKMCRVCLETQNELRSIYKMGKILDYNVKLCDVLADCTSLVVRFNWFNIFYEGMRSIWAQAKLDSFIWTFGLSEVRVKSGRVLHAQYARTPGIFNVHEPQASVEVSFYWTVNRTGCYPLWRKTSNESNRRNEKHLQSLSFPPISVWARR